MTFLFKLLHIISTLPFSWVSIDFLCQFSPSFTPLSLLTTSSNVLFYRSRTNSSLLLALSSLVWIECSMWFRLFNQQNLRANLSNVYSFCALRRVSSCFRFMFSLSIWQISASLKSITFVQNALQSTSQFTQIGRLGIAKKVL